MDDDNCLSVFLKELTNDPEEEEGEEESDHELNEDDSTKQEHHTKSYKETITGLEDIALFLRAIGNTKQAM